MAYLWSDKIIDYYYSNPELDTVAVLWKDPEDGLTREHYIKVDESDEQWRDFVAEVSYDDINSRTEERHEHFREEFREAFRLWTDRPENNMSAEYTPVNESIHNFILNYDPKDTVQKEELFKFKLKIFEQEIVKNSKLTDKFKNAKTFIRKAENPMDVLLGYMVFTNGAELKMAAKEKFKVEGIYIPIK